MSLRLAFTTLVALASFAFIGVTAALAGSVTLSWTTPGDDSLTGRASRFDVRYSIQAITPANFSQATAAGSLPNPSTPGSTQSTRIDGLTSGQIYFFAMKCADEAGNWSLMSNEVSGLPQEVAGLAVALQLQFSAPWPNPARQGAQFRLELPDAMQVRVEVFDVSGRKVRSLLDEFRGAGTENLAFDLHDDRGSRLSQGIYLVRARLGEAVVTRRLVVSQ